MRYYVYENWQATSKAKIHEGSCGHCNHGEGHNPGHDPRHGHWHGPFGSYAEAHQAAVATGRTVSDCGHCKPAWTDDEVAEAKPDGIPSMIQCPLSNTPPEDPRARSWLSIVASEMVKEEPIQEFIEKLREAAGLVDPLTTDDLAANRLKPRHQVWRTAEQLAIDYAWDERVELLAYIFDPELIKTNLAAFLRADTPEPTEEDELLFTSIPEGLYLFFVRAGFQRLFSQICLDLFTDYAISGNLSPVPPIPSWFTGGTYKVPFMESHLVISLSSVFSDRKQQVADLNSELRRAYVTGERDRPRKNPERDKWIMDQYLRIIQDLSEEQEHSQMMAKLLEEDEIKQEAIYSQLLKLCLESVYAADFECYDLSSPRGRRQAKVFLAEIVFRERAAASEILGISPPPPNA